MAMSKSVNLAHAQSAVPCNVCEDEVPGEYYCLECKQTLCPQCEKNHKRVAATRKHNIVLRSQVGDIDTGLLTCTDHDEPALFHCDKCKIPICGKCVTGKHQGHKMVDLTSTLEKEKKSLQSDVTRMKREILPKLKKRQEEISKRKENHEKEIQRITKEMEDENKELNRIHAARMKNLESTRNSHLAAFDNMSRNTKMTIKNVEKTITEYDDAIRRNSLPVIIDFNKRKEPLPDVGSKLEIPDAPTYVPGNLQSVVKYMGKLQVSPALSVSKQLKLTTPISVSQFKCPLQGLPSICITKEGYVWLGGLESRELVMVNIKGQVLRRRKIQNRPKVLAVMDCGDVIMSPHYDDSSSVSRLLRDGGEQHLYDTSPSWSRGVSVTADQKILICTFDGRVVRINSDGTHVKQIYKGSGDGSAVYAVEKSDGNIYISDYRNNAVVMISNDGKVLTTITHTTGGQQLVGPWGLVVDKMDNILCADYYNNCVYIIDQDQQVRELVGSSHGIKNPQWLAVDNDNNLWITQVNGNVHVVKYLSP